MLTVNDVADIIFELLASGGVLNAGAGGGMAKTTPAPRGEKPTKPELKPFKCGYGTGFYKGFVYKGPGAAAAAGRAFGAKGGHYYGGAARPKKVFLTDRELRIMLRSGSKVLAVPRGTIISPLAMDWIDFDGIELRFE